MIILLDTNVLIAAFIARGACNELLEHCIRQHNLITSDFIISEFRDKLANKFKLSQSEVDQAAELLLSRMKLAAPAALEAAICRDPDDDNILAAAAGGSCDCIITGDKDLLTLKQYNEIDILKPGDFREYEALRQMPG